LDGHGDGAVLPEARVGGELAQRARSRTSQKMARRSLPRPVM
jgi:hypothetical protein